MTTKAKASWGHRIERIPEDKIPKATGADGKPPTWARCSRRSCQRLHLWWGFYCYITGRAGRTTPRRIHLCQEHAEQFAKEHGLAIDSLPPSEK